MKPVRLINPLRLRTHESSFAYIPHRFLRGGFWQTCSIEELCLYMLLILVADRRGMSFYSPEKLSLLCRMETGELQEHLCSLSAKDLIARQDIFVQVLSLPDQPLQQKEPPPAARTSGPVSVAKALKNYLSEKKEASR